MCDFQGGTVWGETAQILAYNLFPMGWLELLSVLMVWQVYRYTMTRGNHCNVHSYVTLVPGMCYYHFPH